MNKVTVIGDIICDKEMLKAGRSKDKSYDFNSMFSPLKKIFKDSDYVIANLESIISDNNYTKGVFSFSNPKELLIALKKVGINAVSLANNHILDSGYEGLEQTISFLKKYDIDFFGISSLDNKEGVLNINLSDVKLSLLGYTDSTNYHINKCKLDTSTKYKINLIKKKNNMIYKRTFLSKLYHKLNPEIRIKIKNICRKKINPVLDDYILDDKCIIPIKKIVNNLKKQNRFILMYPHIGGQYNIDVGNYTNDVVKKLHDIGCDSVVVTHPHIIQNMKINNNCFNSIGDLIISPKSKYVLWETLPEYSLAINYYFEKNNLIKITLTLLICVKDDDSYLKVYPFYDFYNKLDYRKKQKYKKEYEEICNRLHLGEYKVEKEWLVK